MADFAQTGFPEMPPSQQVEPLPFGCRAWVSALKVYEGFALLKGQALVLRGPFQCLFSREACAWG